MQAVRALAVLATLYFAPFVIVWPNLVCQAEAAPDSTALAGHVAVLVSGDEPGEPMVVKGRLLAADGVTPVAGAEIYVYHTDINGYYSGRTTRSETPRIRGTLTTDTDGRYEIRSIRPGPYPAARIPAHVHYVVRRVDGGEQRFELRFADDPLLSQRQLEVSRGLGRFGNIKPLTRTTEGVWHTEHDLRSAP